ncbi:MAG: LPS assembly lipoprotein LptE [Holosporales bacterium]
MYAPSTAQNAAPLPSLTVSTIADRSGQILREALEQRLGRSQSGDYRLDVTLEENLQYLGIQKDSTTSYVRLSLIATYRVVDQKTNKAVYKDQARSQSGYTVVISDYGNLVAEQDAREKTLQELAVIIDQTVRLQLPKLAAARP